MATIKVCLISKEEAENPRDHEGDDFRQNVPGCPPEPDEIYARLIELCK